MKDEVWLPVVGHEGIYSVSSHGQIKRLERYVLRKTGAIQKLAEITMQPTSGKSMYQSVRLSKDKVAKTFYVHFIVLSAFVGPRPTGFDACHKDGNRKNNSILNLRWDTRTANHADKLGHGTACIGELHPCAKLTNELVEKLRMRRLEGASITTLANEFSITRMTASRAASRKSWSHI